MIRISNVGFDESCVISSNLYEPRYNGNLDNSLVTLALMRRLHRVQLKGIETISVSGPGRPVSKPFLFDQIARVCLGVMKIGKYVNPMCGRNNMGSSEGRTITVLAKLIHGVERFSNRVLFDINRPVDTKRKVMSTTCQKQKLYLLQVGLRERLASTFSDFQNAL